MNRRERRQAEKETLAISKQKTNDHVILKQVLNEIELLKITLEGSNLEVFEKSDVIFFRGCAFTIAHIGELLSRISCKTDTHELINVNLRAWKVLRNRIAHRLEKLDRQVVWDTFQIELPSLQYEIETFLKAESQITVEDEIAINGESNEML